MKARKPKRHRDGVALFDIGGVRGFDIITIDGCVCVIADQNTGRIVVCVQDNRKPRDDCGRVTTVSPSVVRQLADAFSKLATEIGS